MRLRAGRRPRHRRTGRSAGVLRPRPSGGTLTAAAGSPGPAAAGRGGRVDHDRPRAPAVGRARPARPRPSRRRADARRSRPAAAGRDPSRRRRSRPRPIRGDVDSEAWHPGQLPRWYVVGARLPGAGVEDRPAAAGAAVHVRPGELVGGHGVVVGLDGVLGHRVPQGRHAPPPRPGVVLVVVVAGGPLEVGHPGGLAGLDPGAAVVDPVVQERGLLGAHGRHDPHLRRPAGHHGRPERLHQPLVLLGERLVDHPQVQRLAVAGALTGGGDAHRGPGGLTPCAPCRSAGGP